MLCGKQLKVRETFCIKLHSLNSILQFAFLCLQSHDPPKKYNVLVQLLSNENYIVDVNLIRNVSCGFKEFLALQGVPFEESEKMAVALKRC